MGTFKKEPRIQSMRLFTRWMRQGERLPLHTGKVRPYEWTQQFRDCRIILQMVTEEKECTYAVPMGTAGDVLSPRGRLRRTDRALICEADEACTLVPGPPLPQMPQPVAALHLDRLEPSRSDHPHMARKGSLPRQRCLNPDSTGTPEHDRDKLVKVDLGPTQSVRCTLRKTLVSASPRFKSTGLSQQAI